MLLEILEEKREKHPLRLRGSLKRVAKLPFWLQPAEPKKRPMIIDKLCLMELGLNETQVEILLALWEAGGKLPIWGEGTKDLCHELNTTSRTIIKHLRRLKELGFVKVSFTGRKDIVTAKSPKKVFDIVEKSLNARFQILSELFKLKQKEFEEKVRSYKEIIPKNYNLSSKAKKNLKELKKSKRIVCGFVTGKIENKGMNIKVKNFIPIKTRSGPKIHYDPVWKDYHKVKKELIKDKQWLIGEFHTHVDGSSKPHERDLEKMKLLSRGIWWILGEKTVCYFFNKTHNNKLNLIEIPLASLKR